MTLAYSQAKVIYEGNAQTVRWEIPFPYLDESDLKIALISAGGVTQILQADYTVDEETHTVLYPKPESQTPPLAVGCKLMILRRTPLTQQTGFSAQQSFDPFILEEGYDKAMMIAQEQAEELARAVKFPASQAVSKTDAAQYLCDLQQALDNAQSASALAEKTLSSAQQANETAQEAVQTAQECSEALEDYMVSSQQASVQAAASAQTAQTAQNAAAQSTLLAQKWAVQTSEEVEVGLGYGAKKYAQNAASSASAAALSEASSAQNAQTAQNGAQQSAASASLAASSAAAAQTAQAQSESFASAASASAQAAEDALSGKVDTDLSNIPSAYDYVIESQAPTADNPSWYRKYKSGWVEQGGRITTQSGWRTVSFLKPFQILPQLQTSPYAGTGVHPTVDSLGGKNLTLTGVELYCDSNMNNLFWTACGLGASSTSGGSSGDGAPDKEI